MFIHHLEEKKTQAFMWLAAPWSYNSMSFSPVTVKLLEMTGTGRPPLPFLISLDFRKPLQSGCRPGALQKPPTQGSMMCLFLNQMALTWS